MTLFFASMENNRLNQQQFNKEFFSAIPLTYFCTNIVVVMIMSLTSILAVKHFDEDKSNQNDFTFEDSDQNSDQEGESTERNKRS